MKADLGNRIVAFIIDSIIVGVISSIFSSIYGALAGIPIRFWVGVELGTEDLWTVVVYAAYFVIFAVTKEGQTFGKLAMNLEIRHENGAQLEQDKLLLRELIKALLMPISFISFLFVIFRDDNQSIHDLLFETNVFVDQVRENKKPVDPDEPQQPPKQKPKQDDDDPFGEYYD